MRPDADQRNQKEFTVSLHSQLPGESTVDHVPWCHVGPLREALWSVTRQSGSVGKIYCGFHRKEGWGRTKGLASCV